MLPLVATARSPTSAGTRRSPSRAATGGAARRWRAATGQAIDHARACAAAIEREHEAGRVLACRATPSNRGRSADAGRARGRPRLHERERAGSTAASRRRTPTSPRPWAWPRASSVSESDSWKSSSAWPSPPNASTVELPHAPRLEVVAAERWAGSIGVRVTGHPAYFEIGFVTRRALRLAVRAALARAASGPPGCAPSVARRVTAWRAS